MTTENKQTKPEAPFWYQMCHYYNLLLFLCVFMVGFIQREILGQEIIGYMLIQFPLILWLLNLCNEAIRESYWLTRQHMVTNPQKQLYGEPCY